MKIPIAIFAAAMTSPLFAQADRPMLHDRALPVVDAPSFKVPLAAPFGAAKGKWTPGDGVLSVLDIAEEKHIPVLHHKVGLAAAAIECEFRFDGPGTFLVGCDGDRHIGRVVVSATGVSIAEDSVKPSHTIARLPLEVKQGRWHRLLVEWKADQMAARLDGKELRAAHPFLATPKSRSWLAAGQTVKVRNLKISGEANGGKP